MMLGIRKLHFIGIGGVGMSGIAEILHNSGFTVCGSDCSDSEHVTRLRQLGINIHIGHAPGNVAPDTDICVFSSAVRSDNVEIIAANKMNIPVIKRAMVLAELMRIKDGIAIAGSHGKSTTTAICGKVFIDSGADPTVIIGGRFDYIKGNAQLGKGDFLIAEADESDRSFLHLSPVINIVTSIDNDHLDTYGTLADLKRSFAEFMNKVPFFGFNIVNADDDNIKSILSAVTARYLTYGLDPGADYRAEDISFKGRGMEFRAVKRGADLGVFSIPYPGEHYVANALSVIALTDMLSMDQEPVRRSLSSYSGLSRRMEYMGTYNGAAVYNDYGHHPTEIKCTLGSFVKLKKNRLITVFQPHRFTRTKMLFKEFSRCFDDTDLLFIADIYAASEDPIPGINSKVLAEKIGKRKRNGIIYLGNTDIKNALEGIRPAAGDIILFLGAGNYFENARRLVNED